MTDTLTAGASNRILATDLDGTLLPLADDDQNRADLQTLARGLRDNGVPLVFVTGRHLASVANAIEQCHLPVPDWIICDVGTSIFERRGSGDFQPIHDYDEHWRRVISEMPVGVLRELVEPIQELQLQESEKQGNFKLSYYANAKELDRIVDQLAHELARRAAPYSIIHSVDPFNGDGLIDLVPAGASKAYALEWWCTYAGLRRDAIVFAGDSGNDLAALTAGHRAIVVANADRRVVQCVYDQHRKAGWKNRLYIARNKATSGVLEGCRWFELIDQDFPPVHQLGATPLTEDRTHFRVWAPNRRDVRVELIDGASRPSCHVLARDEQGYFTGVVSGAPPHSRYRYLLDGEVSCPDPASRYQPAGVHGASEIIHPDAFPWTDSEWTGIAKRDLIIYELHVGAFTKEGTFRAAIERLPELVDLGITAIEVMPVAQSPGRWNWGYDGVDLFAVRNTYGEPNDFKALVDACHRNGVAVILDVVYNHVGPEGNYLSDLGPYFSERHRTPWGEAFNFDGPHAQHVRQFILENAIRWLDEYHLDGLRLDAVHYMYDESTPNILQEIRAAVSDYAEASGRRIHLIAEANVYDADLLQSKGGEAPYDAIWCDCLMHSIYTHALPDLQLSHRVYRGASDLAEALKFGFVYYFSEDGPVRATARQRRDLSRKMGPSRIASLVTSLQNHDGVGNHPQGKRLHHLTSKAFQKAAAALTVLYPSIPLIFMGEEYACDAVFPFFADFEDPALREAVDKGRASEYPQHAWANAVAPSDARAFVSARCHAAADGDKDMRDWYRKLIELRKQGRAEGWLCASRMTVSHDSEKDLFSVCFAKDDGAISIQARLAGMDNQSTVSADVRGEIVLSSEPMARDEDGHIRLRPNHAVIIRRGGGR